MSEEGYHCCRRAAWFEHLMQQAMGEKWYNAYKQLVNFVHGNGCQRGYSSQLPYWAEEYFALAQQEEKQRAVVEALLKKFPEREEPLYYEQIKELFLDEKRRKERIQILRQICEDHDRYERYGKSDLYYDYKRNEGGPR